MKNTMTKQEMIKKIAEHRAATTLHKDINVHISALSKMTTRELEMVMKRI